MRCAIEADLSRYLREEDARQAEADAFDEWIGSHTWEQMIDVAEILNALNDGEIRKGTEKFLLHSDPAGFAKALKSALEVAVEQAWIAEIEKRADDDAAADDYDNDF